MVRLDYQDEMLQEIKVTTKETNGRVRELEKWRAKLDGFRTALSWQVTTGIALAAMAGGFLLGH